MNEKCTFPKEIRVKLDGIHEVDPCEYEVAEKFKNVTVEILKCKKCGHIEIGWYRQVDTERIV